MIKFAFFLISVAIFIYFGVWFVIGLALYTVYVLLLLLIWNKGISEILPVPELGMFGGFILSFFVDVIGVTIWASLQISQTA